MRIIKHDEPEIIDRQLEFFESVSPKLRPIRIKRTRDNAYTFEWVEGKEASSIKHVEMLAGKLPDEIWRRNSEPEPPTTGERLTYIRYVMGKARSVTDDRHELSIFDHMMTLGLLRDQVFGARQVHGDLTMENIIVRSNGKGFALIDPGHPRGLYCEEIDISKLMQSIVTHWEVALGKRKIVPTVTFMKLRPVTVALLLSHWIRLLAHREKHPKKALQYGKRVVFPALIDEYASDEWRDYMEHGGSGWNPDRLSERCLRELRERVDL